jgi:glutamate-5-semialdehyde dehydrogenase
MTSDRRLQAGDWVAIGRSRIRVTPSFADSLKDGDDVLALAATGELRRLPREVVDLVESAVKDAAEAFKLLSEVPDASINDFFVLAARALSDDQIFAQIQKVNEADVRSAETRGRSTTRLVLSESMRRDMIEALSLWSVAPMSRDSLVGTTQHSGWFVEQRTAPLGVIGFVFEGRPNVFADATGVLKGGNTVVFRIGSDALRTANAIMDLIVRPSLIAAGLPVHSVVLLNSVEHAAGWALFSQTRLSLAVARGSGAAVAEPVSLHGTGGAWMLLGEKAHAQRIALAVEHSLDRKVCNTLNVVCVLRSLAGEHIPIVVEAAERASHRRDVKPRFHAVSGAEKFIKADFSISVHRSDGVSQEKQVTTAEIQTLAHEYEWEVNPEFAIVLVDSLSDAVQLFNLYSPQFVVSIISEDEAELQSVWATANAPFVGNGFTRWVDGQFCLLRPELGLSNWEHGRLFGRSGVLSGDSAFSVRLRVQQDDADVHR